MQGLSRSQLREVLRLTSSAHEWSSYFRAGLCVAIELLRKKRSPAGNNPVGMDTLVDGAILSGAGLSSSVGQALQRHSLPNGEAKADKLW